MRRKRIIFALCALLCLSLSAGCGASGAAGGTEIQFYYGVASDRHTGASLVSEGDTLAAPTVSTVMSRLLRGPESQDLTALIPEGTTLLSWTLEDGVLTLDLSEAFGRLTGISLTRAKYSIVLTLTQLEGVEAVSITVDGQFIPGSGADQMSAGDVILRGETEDPVTISSQLYFPLTDLTGLGVEYREIEVESLDLLDQANAILKELALGPAGEEMSGFLSGMGVLEAVSVRDGVCVVELDSATLECICRPEEQFALRLYAIVDSLTELGDIEQVSFRLEGQSIEGWEASYSAQYEF